MGYCAYLLTKCCEYVFLRSFVDVFVILVSPLYFRLLLVWHVMVALLRLGAVVHPRSWACHVINIFVLLLTGVHFLTEIFIYRTVDGANVAVLSTLLLNGG